MVTQPPPYPWMFFLSMYGFGILSKTVFLAKAVSSAMKCSVSAFKISPLQLFDTMPIMFILALLQLSIAFPKVFCAAFHSKSPTLHIPEGEKKKFQTKVV